MYNVYKSLFAYRDWVENCVDVLAWNLSFVGIFFKSSDQIFVKFLLYIFILISTYTFFPISTYQVTTWAVWAQLHGLPGCRQGFLALPLCGARGLLPSSGALGWTWSLALWTVGPRPRRLAASAACSSSLVTCSVRRDGLLLHATDHVSPRITPGFKGVHCLAEDHL